MKVTLGTNSTPDPNVTDSDNVQPDPSKNIKPSKESDPFAEIPDFCSCIDTLIYDIGCTPIAKDKEKILGKLIGAMELLQGNLK